jgi:hypothetical protein
MGEWVGSGLFDTRGGHMTRWELGDGVGGYNRRRGRQQRWRGGQGQAGKVQQLLCSDSEDRDGSEKGSRWDRGELGRG